jgi:hypothetical protein
MLTTFDIQWSKQTSIPTILLHGIDDFNSLVDYACRQYGYHCHTVNIYHIEINHIFYNTNSLGIKSITCW